MRTIPLLFSLLLLLALGACAPSVTPTQPPATEPPAVLTPDMPYFEGNVVNYLSLNLVIPQGLAVGYVGNQYTAVEAGEASAWDVAPAHFSITLDGYPLSDRKHKPTIYVYPATDYGLASPAAFEAIHRLRNLFVDPAATPGLDQLPEASFLNSVQTFASAVRLLDFHTGQGVRFVTQTNQGIVQTNNQELIYHFEGLSETGDWYIVAILPISHPLLAETGDLAAPVPQGGVPFPDLSVPDASTMDYNAAIQALLSGAAPESFTPALSLLDQLVQSIEMTP